LYSKLMCWVALERAVALADRLEASDRVEAWKQAQAQIREAILTRGWSDRANAFTQFFGSDELDASNLMLPLVGFLPADDPRVLATIDATEECLIDERGLVYRYRSHDGLEGDEGTFLLHFLAGPGPGQDRTGADGRPCLGGCLRAFQSAAAAVNVRAVCRARVSGVWAQPVGVPDA
jgi:hypothetical protein